MIRRSRAVAGAIAVAGLAAAWMGCAQIFGIDDANAVPDPTDASSASDTTTPSDGSMALDAGDAGHDGSVLSDATAADAPPETCASRVTQMLASPISPAIWGGLDFSIGGTVTDVPGNGGLTMPQTGLIPCADYVEPATLPSGVAPIAPGYRTYGFGLPDGGAMARYPFTLQANAQSQVVEFVSLEDGYRGTLAFSSRPGGAYGAHTYELAVGAVGADGGAAASGGGYVKRDGADFAADWQYAMNDGGVQTASAWANELYDGLMATFAPATPAIDDCLSIASTTYVGVLATHGRSSCFFNPNYGTFSELGIRPILLYITFNVGTNQPTEIYYFWNGGTADCNTPVANAERMDFSSVGYETLGGLFLGTRVSNPNGLTYIEADKVECSGIAWSPPDPGYGGYQWGQNGEVAAEYVLDSGLVHAIYARSGYEGTMPISDATYTNNYVLTIGAPATNNGAPFTIDWPTSGTPVAATTLSNAYCQTTDTDCVADGDCTVSYDGSGNMVLGITCGQASATGGVVFTHDTSTAQEFFVTNPSVP